MRRIAPIWLLICCSLAQGQAPVPGTYVFSKRNSSHVAKLVIQTRAFDAKHKIGYDKNIGNVVDGRKAYGAEYTPRTEIASLRLYFDGRQIPVARGLYSDCYEPNVYAGKGASIRFARNSQTVFVSVFGADGAGSYHVIWVFGRNGHHRRYFKPTF
jgi:hypothetical protein